MSENKNSLECNAICWILAAAVGFISMIMLFLLAEFTALQAIFTGGLIGFLLGVILSLFVCRGQKAASDLAAEEKPAQRYAREAAEQQAERDSRAPAAAPTVASGSDATDAASQGASAPSAATSSTAKAAADTHAEPAATASASATPSSLMSGGVKPSTPLAGEADLASRKGGWKYEAGTEGSGIDAKKSAAVEKAPKKAPAAEPAKAAPTPAPAASSSASLEGATSDGESPLLYSSAPSEGADDLKLISGVGPKLEQTLNDMGVYRFAQVAIWGPKDIAWVDDRLRFKGRIERDDWMSQAKILAEGGETEFSKKKK